MQDRNNILDKELEAIILEEESFNVDIMNDTISIESDLMYEEFNNNNVVIDSSQPFGYSNTFAS